MRRSFVPVFLLILTVVLIFVLGTATGAKAQTVSAPECAGLTARLFAATGVNDFIGALPEGVQRGAAASLANTKMSPADARRVQASLMKAFAPAKVDHAIRAEFVRSCDPGSLREAISDMSDPVAVRMVRLEAMTQNPQVQARLQGFIAALSQHPPAAERLQLIQRLDTSSGGTALLADTIQVTMRTIMALEGRPAAANSPGAQIPKSVLDSLHNMVLTTLLFTYRDVSDQELGQYADIWERPALRNFTASFSQAFIGTLQLQMVEFWNDFVQPVSTAGRSKP